MPRTRVTALALSALTLTASGVLLQGNGAADAAVSPPVSFTQYAAPAALVPADGAGEPSIGTNWKSGATLYQAGFQTLKVLFDDSVSPAKATWTDHSADATTGCPQGSTLSLDPIMWTDHASGRTIESQLIGFDSLSCTTDNDGTAWAPSQGGGIPSGVDHQTIGGGPFSASGVGPLPVGGASYGVYYCSQDIATAFCALSRDGGTTFGPGVPVYSLLDCGGLHGHVKVAPDGTAYVPNSDCNGAAAVTSSTDNGATWTVHRVPGTTAGASDPSVGIGAGNTTYIGYTNADGLPGVAVTRNHGTTWTDVQTIGADLGIKNAVLPAVVAGDDGRAAMAFIGSTTAGDFQDINTFHGDWHLYVANTFDGGHTWTTVDTTPTDPVQRGSICLGGTTCGADRNLLDFIDATLDKQGRVEVGYADGCTGTCVTGGVNTRTATATIARQSGGRGLFSAFDPVASFTNVTVKSVGLSLNASTLTAKTAISNTGTTTIPELKVQVVDNGVVVAKGTVRSLAAGATKTLNLAWTAATGVHSVRVVADPTNVLVESNEADNSGEATFTR